MRTKNREYWRKKAATTAKKIVRLQSNYTCAYCGRSEPIIKTHGSHIYAEGTYRNMSADLDNILCLCYTHHIGSYMQSKHPSWHKNPVEMVEWFINKYPERYQKLKKRTQIIYEVNFEEKYASLKRELEQLQISGR